MRNNLDLLKFFKYKKQNVFAFSFVKHEPFFKTLDYGVIIISNIKVILIGFNATL